MAHCYHYQPIVDDRNIKLIYSVQDQKYTRNSYTSSAKWVYILIDSALLVQCKSTKPWNSNSSKEPFQQY